MFQRFFSLGISPYTLTLFGLFLGMSVQTFAAMLACQTWWNRRNAEWFALAAAMLLILRQRWAALDFAVATGVYDWPSMLCDFATTIVLLGVVIGFRKN
jgi:hypothetical protein